MRTSELTTLGLAYDDTGHIVTYAIGRNGEWIGSVNKVGNHYRAIIDTAIGTGDTPKQAAQNAWASYRHLNGQSFGFAPPAADEPPTPSNRVSVKTIEGHAGRRFQILVDGKRKGEVRKQDGGGYVARVDGSEGRSLKPLVAACRAWDNRLAWIEKAGLV